MTEKRKIIQIAIDPDPEGSPTIFALADDGTIWRGWWSEGKFNWKSPLPELPQK